MNKKLLVSAVAFATISTAHASSFLAGDPVEAVADKDTAFDNPAFLLNTKNQVAISDYGDVGAVFNAFGQKLAAHGGRSGNAIDLFWAGGMDFGQVGVRLGYELDNTNDLFITTYNGQSNFTYFNNDSDTTSIDVGGADSATLQVNDNINKFNTSELQIEAGYSLADMPISGTVQLTLAGQSDVETFELVDTLLTDGQTTATYSERETVVQTDSVESDGGLIAEVTGRYMLNNQTYVTGGLTLDNRTLLDTNKDVLTEYDLDIAGGNTVDVNQTTTTEFTTESEDNNLWLTVGLDHRRFIGPAMFKVQPTLTYHSNTVVDTDRVVEDTFRDVVTPTNNTTAATGITDITETKTTEIFNWVRVSTEFLTSERWTWRGGAWISLFEYNSTKTTYTQNQAVGTSYEEDYVSVTDDGGNLEILNQSGTIDLGFTYKPNENITLDADIEADQQALQNWSANFGLTVFY